MLKLLIDQKIFEDFVKSQPLQIPLGSEEDNDYWNSLWKFMKCGGDIEMVNFNDNYSDQFLKVLTTGRKGTKLTFNSSFKEPHKQLLPKDTGANTIFFINEEDEEKQVAYRKKNSLAFGFPSDYNNVWKKLALINERSELSVRNVEGGFSNWKQLNNYFVSLTDVIIVDNYIIDDRSVVDSNLMALLEILQSKSSLKFNLIIVTYEGSKIKLNLENEIKYLKEKLLAKSIQCDLSVVLASFKVKEHDRGVFTNYLRIKSGDSFNFFNSRGEFITKGTELDFYSLVDENKSRITSDALESIKKLILSSPSEMKFGDFKNRLL